MNQQILIIGGMGPQASIELHRRIIASAGRHGAVNGDDFPEIIHASLPIRDFINGREFEPAANAINRALDRFRSGTNQRVVIACNTAHLLIPQLIFHDGQQLVSLIDETVGWIAAKQYRRVGLLASPTTLRSGLYRRQLNDLGVRLQTPDSDELLELESIIRATIGGQAGQAVRLGTMVNHMLASGCERVLLGCTELSLVAGQLAGCIDPLQVVVPRLLGLSPGLIGTTNESRALRS